MKRKLNEIIYTISRYTEIVLSAIMLLVIITLIVPMLYNFLRIPLLDITPGQFTEFLGNALTLLIGVEHLNMGETLIGVVAIGIIFAIRKYLLLKNSNDKEKTYDKL